MVCFRIRAATDDNGLCDGADAGKTHSMVILDVTRFADDGSLARQASFQAWASFRVRTMDKTGQVALGAKVRQWVTGNEDDLEKRAEGSHNRAETTFPALDDLGIRYERVHTTEYGIVSRQMGSIRHE
jgi:hypothetical protein